MYTYMGNADDETGEVEEFPSADFENDFFSGEETTISPIIRTIEADGSSRYFDLQGRQLTAPAAKGIYIRDGKKVMNK